MEQKNQRNSRKRLNSLILLVAFTAIMLIVSTYAWFSTQKNVTLKGLQGHVNVAEGLQISLDGLNWKNEIDLSETGITAYFADTNASLGTEYDLSNPYTGRYNAVPTELLPASTTGQAADATKNIAADGIGLNRLNMYRGENTDAIVLSKIGLLPEDGTKADVNENGSAAGYYAIDLFLQNSSSTTAVTAGTPDELRLETNSKIDINTAGKASTGLQNTLRVAFALFDNAGTGGDVVVSNTPSQAQILKGMEGQNITDVAIWEPNASGAEVVAKDESGQPVEPKAVTRYASHVDYIVQNNNNVTWSKDDLSTYFNETGATAAAKKRFAADQAIPTYALTAASAAANEVTGAPAGSIANIYDWATPATGLVKQVTNQTTTAGIGNDPIQLKSIKGTDFAIAPGEYHKIRMYVWLEGQDVDCINYASLGGDVIVEVGLSKEGTVVTQQEPGQGGD